MITLDEGMYDIWVDDIAELVDKDDIYVAPAMLIGSSAQIDVRYKPESGKTIKTMDGAYEILKHVVAVAQNLLKTEVYEFPNLQLVANFIVNTEEGVSLSAIIWVNR